MKKMSNFCQRCELCKNNSHQSIDKGRTTANVLFIFGKETFTKRIINQKTLFLRKLNNYLAWDWHYTYAVRCVTDKPIEFEHIKSCRHWVNKTIKSVDPYLIVLMGKTAVRSVLGEKYKRLPTGIFYMKNVNGKKRQYYIGCRISEKPPILEKHLDKLILFIKENYG